MSGAGAGGRNYGSTMDRVPEVGFTGGAGPSTGYFDEAQFFRLCDSVASNVFQIGKHATTLEKTLKTIGGRNDSDTVRDSVHVVTKTALGIISETTHDVKEITSLIQKPVQFQGSIGSDKKMRVTRLTSDFQQSVQRFNNIQKQIVVKMKATVLPPPSNAGLMDDEEIQKQALVEHEEQQAQMRLQQALEFEQGLLLEREDRVNQIQSDIIDCNDIMKELATLVNEQAEVIDTIEDNVQSAYNEVDAGRAELQKAETYQARYRKRLFCLLAAGVIITIIVIIILVTQLKS
ncbi:Syntaxin-7 [Orchesella cincta]|uniref:Syntaxin-7 n=1 Tax=Orchesella cincta TaxID=48709 RepID=A0A1D2NIX5_ORCCI|nr:Syntaxin-7 [Orchesella cincta]